MTIMVGQRKQTGMVLEKYLRTLHPDPQAAAETGVAQAFEI